MHNVVVVMPVRGRAEQSIECMKRLMKFASYHATFIAVGGHEDLATINRIASEVSGVIAVPYNDKKATYWQALKRATDALPDDALVVNVANDLIPAIHWLRNAVTTYDHYSNDYIVGFNGDGYQYDHSCHFLISMKHLRELGGWPIWYHHNFGDTELITRAKANHRYIKDVFAILFHNHPIISGAQNDMVYEEGSITFAFDQALFEKRKAAQWSSAVTRL